MENKKKVILDCDPGHDDAFGIMLAVQHLDVLGITTIGGNCTLENVTRNAIKVLEVLGVADRIGVYPGHSCPMVAPLVTAPQFHGETGLDGPVLPEPTHAAQNKHAVDFIVDTVMSTDDVTLIATGPLTNIASAINREPRIVERVKELCIMGGSVTYGNWTPAAEFNIFVDPEAASRVFNSGMHVKMTGINLTRQCELTAKHVAKFREIGTKAANLAADLTDFFIGVGRNGANLSDFLVGRSGLGKLLELSDGGGNSLVDAALKVHRVHAGGNELHAFINDGLRENRSSGRTVTGVVARLRGDFADHGGTHVFKFIFEFNFFGDRHAILRDRRAAERAFKHNVATLRAERYLDSIGENVDTANHFRAGIITEKNLLSSHFVIP